MDGTIYLIGKGGELEEMFQQPYEKEDILQKYLEDYPNLLPGDQIDQTSPRKWLLISREMGIPGEEGGSDRLSVDHFFLDQDGTPTLVEVKRSSDLRSRREVVAQMLDYAANVVAYKSIEAIRTKFESNCERDRVDPNERVQKFLDTEDAASVDNFWEKTKTNLQAENIRLIFVADHIQPELRRIVEFLNGQMTPAEVLAVEIPQYVGMNQKAVVPRVIGLTAKAETLKGKRPPKVKWDEESFFESLRALNPDAAKCAREIYDWANDHELPITWGSGTGGSFIVCVRHQRNNVGITGVDAGPRYTDGAMVYFQANTLRTVPPFTSEDKLLEVVRRLNQIPEVRISEGIIDDPTKYPGIAIRFLRDPAAMKQFLDALESIVKEIEGEGRPGEMR